jgi:sugar-specific transcriptional regulator TrmB
MSNNIIDDLIEFLKAANLTTYEINAFITLLQSADYLTARTISSKSSVPSGRVYEILDDLHQKGMISIIESRPKKFKSLPLNRAFYNLLSYQTEENRRKTAFLFNQAKILEKSVFQEEIQFKAEPTKLFWSTAYGTQSIMTLYQKYCNEAQNELIFNNFINKNTLKILNYAHKLYEPIKNALDRGLKAKFLWSFEHDDRPLSNEVKKKNLALFTNIVKKHEELFQITPKTHDVEMKILNHKLYTYYDIIDKQRILFKLRNPLKPHQIFACMNVLDLNLAKELREKFYNIWTFEAHDLNNKN